MLLRTRAPCPSDCSMLKIDLKTDRIIILLGHNIIKIVTNSQSPADDNLLSHWSYAVALIIVLNMVESLP